MTQPLLDMQHVDISYGGKPVVQDLSLQCWKTPEP